MEVLKRQTAHLDHWTYDQAEQRLYGIVSNHPRLEDGSEVVTSSVYSFDEEGSRARTRNTDYTLGTKGAGWFLEGCKVRIIKKPE